MKTLKLVNFDSIKALKAKRDSKISLVGAKIWLLIFIGSPVEIYYIPWPAKKIAVQISYQVCLPKTAQIFAACTANWPKLPKKRTSKETFLSKFPDVHN